MAGSSSLFLAEEQTRFGLEGCSFGMGNLYLLLLHDAIGGHQGDSFRLYSSFSDVANRFDGWQLGSARLCGSGRAGL